MAAPALAVIRTDQAAAKHSGDFLSVVQAGRAFYFALLRHRKLMRGGFDDTDPEAIVWDDLEELYGAPVEDINGEPPGKVLWDRVNGALTLLDSNSGDNDFQKLISLTQ